MKWKRLYYKEWQFYDALRKLEELHSNPWVRNPSIEYKNRIIIVQWYQLPRNARNTRMNKEVRRNGRGRK